MLQNGFVVAVEGIDGAGKTTQVRLLNDYLQNQGINTLLSKEPTDSVFGQKIRELAQGKRKSTDPQKEYQLFVDDRKLHVKNIIKPALADGKVVILDRYYFSTMAYQGALGLDPAAIKVENEAFSPIPEVVFIITVPPAVGIDRIRNGRKEIPNAFEHEENLKKVASIFETITCPSIKRIDGTAPIDQVHNSVVSLMDAVIAQYTI